MRLVRHRLSRHPTRVHPTGDDIYLHPNPGLLGHDRASALHQRRHLLLELHDRQRRDGLLPAPGAHPDAVVAEDLAEAEDWRGLAVYAWVPVRLPLPPETFVADSLSTCIISIVRIVYYLRFNPYDPSCTCLSPLNSSNLPDPPQPISSPYQINFLLTHPHRLLHRRRLQHPGRSLPRHHLRLLPDCAALIPPHHHRHAIAFRQFFPQPGFHPSPKAEG